MAYRKTNNGGGYDGPTAEERALDKFADLMIEKIKGMQQDWQKPWFTEGSMKWPKNLSGREYNGMNAVMLMMLCEKEGYKLPVFCTFNRVAGLNFTVGADGAHKPMLDANGEKMPIVSINKGEKSFPVMLTSYTVVNKETREKIKYEDYKQLTDEQKKDYAVYPKLNTYNVFNVAQTNLEQARPELYAKLVAQDELSKPAQREGEKYDFPAVDEMIAKGLWLCPIYPKHQDNCYYSISKDEIVLAEKEQFVNGESFYGTAFHEMIHSTGAESRLNRLKSGSSFGSAEYAREELVAELGAALTATRYGMTKNIKEDSAAYLKSWLESLQESPDYIKTTLQDVRRASSMLSHRIDLVQGQIDSYQQSTGHVNEYPDVYDIDNDGNTTEVVHVETREPEQEKKEEEIAARGFHR